MLNNTNKPDASFAKNGSASKRKLLKLLSTGAVTTGVRVPGKWAAPMVASIVLPSHAQASGLTSDCGTKGTSQLGKNGSGGPTASNPDTCCDELKPANPAYPTSPEYLAEGCCKTPGKADKNICCDDNVADKTDIRYPQQCCDKPAVDSSGKPVKNAQGEYFCCEDLDPSSDDYANFCCENKAKDNSGNLATDPDGNKVCCEGAVKDPVYCCIQKEITYVASIPRTRTNWTTKDNVQGATKFDSVELPKWDPADGPLSSVTLTVTGDIDSEGEFENKDSSSVIATFKAKVVLETEGPAGILLNAQPEENISKELQAGVVKDGQGDDFWKVPTLSASKSESQTITDQADLAQFYIGSASKVDIQMTATGASSFGSTGANFSTDINTFAAATISVRYVCAASEV